ncbi:MAG: penicillin-binding protein 2 [Thiobacillaceae bacterium]
MVSELKNLQAELGRFHGRLKWAAVFAVLLALALLGRLFFMQVLRYERYLAQAESNRITMVPSPPGRGLIMDRKGNALVENYSAYTVELTQSKAGDLDHTLAEIGTLIEITPKDIQRFKKLLEESREFETIPLKSRLTDQEVAILAANHYRLPGVEVKARLYRNYPVGEGLSHVIGHIGRINDSDLKGLKESGRLLNYKGSVHIGKVGLEQSYEAVLHGRTGFDQMETDAAGHAVRLLARVAPVPGQDLILNLDKELQTVAEHAFGDYRGALVALDPNTGGVLAMVSKPGFDPNLFVDGIDPVSWKELIESPDRPMVNRAVNGVYPPGSTIKPFMAMGALELGVRKSTDTIFDPGYYSIPGSSHRYRDWRKGGHGLVDLHKSIVQSVDTYYYRLAVDMGIDRMHDFLSQFGFGSKTGIDLDGESSGLLPSREWKEKRWHKPWMIGETVIAGIGQGYNLMTPLQLAAAVSMLANGGTYYEPHLVKALRDGQTHQEAPIPLKVLHQANFKPEYLQQVRSAMVDVMRPGGTAVAAGAGAEYEIAGKTGTAQVYSVRQNERYDAGRVAKRLRDHALFVAFAPADKPRIALAVIVENGGHGGSTAAPIARAVFDYYLLGRRPPGMIKEGSNESAGD